MTLWFVAGIGKSLTTFFNLWLDLIYTFIFAFNINDTPVTKQESPKLRVEMTKSEIKAEEDYIRKINKIRMESRKLFTETTIT